MEAHSRWKAILAGCLVVIALASQLYGVLAHANGGTGGVSSEDVTSWLDDFYEQLKKDRAFKNEDWSCQVEEKGFRCVRRL